jgi:predicted Ser/Thr protein kinase
MLDIVGLAFVVDIDVMYYARQPSHCSTFQPYFPSMGKKKRTLATTQGHVNIQARSKTKKAMHEIKGEIPTYNENFYAMMWIHGLIHEFIIKHALFNIQR